MDFIIFDLEWNPVFHKGKFIRHEITEIGAVEVSEVDGMLVIGRKFHAFVRTRKPVSTRIKQLTNLQIPDTWLAAQFPNVLKNFEKWLGNKSYIFCAWGNDDRNVLLKNLEFHSLSPNRFKFFFNLQSAYSSLVNKKNGNQVGLKRALESMSLAFKGAPHSSIDDAFNTARIFMNCYRNLAVQPESFVNHSFLDIQYRRQIYHVKHLRESAGISYQELSLHSKLSEQELQQIEAFQRLKSKKEIVRLIKLLYLLRGETVGKK